MQVSGRMDTFPREGISDYSLGREVEFVDMTDAPPTREAKFFALVLPALEEAGYMVYGQQQKLMAETGMSKSTASRLLRGETIPRVNFFPPLAAAIGMDVTLMLVAAEYLPPEYLESQQALSENKQSQVGSEGITPEGAADRLGFQDDMRRALFLKVVESLKTTKPQSVQDDDTGGAAARM